MQRFSNACKLFTFTLVTLLPFLVPFDAYRNVDMQGVIVLIAGFAGMAALLTGGVRVDLNKYSRSLIGLYCIAAVAGLAFGPHNGYSILGSPYSRMGSLGLISAVMCGIVLQQIRAAELARYMYGCISILAIVSMPYTLVRAGSLHRFSGLIAQADIFGALLGCGLLIGLYLWDKSWHRNFVISMQAYLFILLILTGTRATLVLALLLGMAWIIHASTNRVRMLFFCSGCIVLLTLGLHFIVPNRLTDASYASQSIGYRLALQKAGIQASAQKPVFGYGAGNLADALACSKLQASSLVKTCHDRYFFNSSHNIFIDRFLGIGVVGGLSFVLTVVLAVVTAIYVKRDVRIYAYVLLFVSLYYLTNVTNVVLEVLLWTGVLQCLRTNRA